jgi:undecaprenyl pyrophosphate synthase
MAANDGYLKALLALSGNAMFSEARKMLVNSLSEQELETLTKETFSRCNTRKLREELNFALLDILVDGEAAEVEAEIVANANGK